MAKAYSRVAALLENSIIKCLLTFIANDSLKHAESFRTLNRWLGTDVDADFEECIEVWGEKWRSLMNDAERFQHKEKISAEEIGSMISNLERFEGFVAEEYLVVLQGKLIEVMAEKIGMDLGHCKNILEWIEDEKRHEQILKIIKDILAKN